jgi:hypothetical protein
MATINNYSATIDYARINPNNTLLSQSNDGNGDGSGLTISEVIDAPANSGKFISPTVTPSGPTVTCTSDVSATFEAGQYLFYFDASANPILIGQILSIATNVITLTTNIIGVGSAMLNKEIGGSYSLITSSESFFIRISTSVVGSSGGSTVLMPNFSTWRTTPSEGVSSTVRSDISSILQYSNVGNPVTIATSQPNVQFTIITQNVFTSPNNGTTYFNSTGELPQYIWLRANPIPSLGQASGFNPSTMYRFSTNEFMGNAISATVNTPAGTLRNAGYSGVGATTGGSIGANL